MKENRWIWEVINEETQTQGEKQTSNLSPSPSRLDHYVCLHVCEQEDVGLKPEEQSRSHMWVNDAEG